MRKGEAEAAAVAAVDNASLNGAEPVVDTTLFTRDSAAVAIAAVGAAEVSPVWTVPADDARDWGEALPLASGTAADRTDVAAGLELLVGEPEEVGPTGSAFASVVKDLSRVPGTLDELGAPTAGVETGTDDDVSALGVTDAALVGCCEVAAVATIPLVSAAIEVGTFTVVVGLADEEEGAESPVAGVVEAGPPVRIPETIDSRFAEPEVAVVDVGGAKDVVVVGGVRDD